MTNGWGEPEGPSDTSEGISYHVKDLNDGARLEIDPQVARQLLASNQVRQAAWAYADQLATEANHLAGHIGRPERPDPQYVGIGATVQAHNYEAILDEAQNSTLLKILANHQDD